MSSIPITNIFLILFILAMIYWWALQGFFSAFLHLVAVVVAGALAFALWEPLVFSFGMKMQPQYAWGLWLLGPFVLILIALRVAADKLVKKNVQFPNLINNILGGACGLVSGVLTAGITIIGLGFLPLQSSLGGYEPYVVSGGGQVEAAGSDLWVPVDRMATRAFSRLSMAGFYTDQPLAVYQPDLAQQAALYRMRYDENASVIAVPGSVTASAAYAQPLPVGELDAAVGLQLGPNRASGNHKVVLIDTTWTLAAGTYDADSALRIPPTQIRLVTQQERPGGKGALAFHAPLAFVHDQGDGRVFIPFSAANVSAFGNRQSETFGWVFVIPSDQQPLYLLARHLRLDLPPVNREVQPFVAAMGKIQAPEGEQAAEAGAQGPSSVGDREGIRAGHVAEAIELTSALPKATSKNFAPSLRVQDSGVLEGQATVAGNPGNLSVSTRIDKVYIPAHQGGIRLKLSQDLAQSLLGQARVAAASLQGVWLTDARGDQYMPIGYVWFKGGSEQEIWVDRIRQIRSARDLPIPQMSQGDELYLYFAVPKGVKIVEYNIGSSTKQPIDPPLEVR